MILSVASNSQSSQLNADKNLADCSQLTLFCDFDGPIVDVSNRYYSTYQISLETTKKFYQGKGEFIAIQPLNKKEFWQMKQERVGDREIAMRSGLRNKQINFFLDNVCKIVNQPELLSQDKMQPGVNWALALLHSRGVQLILVTLRCKFQVNDILANYGLKRLFTAIYGCQDAYLAYENNTRIKTQLLKKAIRENAIATACMVGDTEADLLAAKEVGIPAIALTCGIRCQPYLQQFKPHRLMSDLLCTANYLLSINN